MATLLVEKAMSITRTRCRWKLLVLDGRSLHVHGSIECAARIANVVLNIAENVHAIFFTQGRAWLEAALAAVACVDKSQWSKLLRQTLCIGCPPGGWCANPFPTFVRRCWVVRLLRPR